MDTLFILPAMVCYAFSAAGFIHDRIRRQTALTGYAAAFLGAGAVFHAFDLIARGLQAGNFPVTNFGQSLSFLALLTALVALVLIVRNRMAVIGAFVAPTVMLAMGGAYPAMRAGRLVLPEPLRSVWLPIHVT